MNALKTFLVWILLGAVLGGVAASLVGPGYLTWDNTATDPSAMCNCLKTSRNTATELIQIQSIGAVIGAVLFLVLGFLVRRRSHPHPPAALPPSHGAGGPPPAA